MMNTRGGVFKLMLDRELAKNDPRDVRLHCLGSVGMTAFTNYALRQWCNNEWALVQLNRAGEIEYAVALAHAAKLIFVNPKKEDRDEEAREIEAEASPTGDSPCEGDCLRYD